MDEINSPPLSVRGASESRRHSIRLRFCRAVGVIASVVCVLGEVAWGLICTEASMGWAGRPRLFKRTSRGDMPGAEGFLTGVRRRDLVRETRATRFTLLVDRVFRGRPGLTVPVIELRQGQQEAWEQSDSESREVLVSMGPNSSYTFVSSPIWWPL